MFKKKRDKTAFDGFRGRSGQVFGHDRAPGMMERIGSFFMFLNLFKLFRFRGFRMSGFPFNPFTLVALFFLYKVSRNSKLEEQKQPVQTDFRDVTRR